MLSKARVLHLYALYQKGYSLNELAEIFGINFYPIWSGFVRHGLKRRPPAGCHLRADISVQKFSESPNLSPAEIENRRLQFLKLPKGRAGCRGYAEYFVEALFTDYLRCGESLTHVAKRWNRSPGAMKVILQARGLRRPDPTLAARILEQQRVDGTGCFAKMKRATPDELRKIMGGMVKIMIPPRLRWEFKTWPMEKRAWFVRTLRARLKSPADRPATPFSRGLVPFDYRTPAARAIKDRLNAGLNSREAVCKIDLCSQGVIYRGELYFWCAKSSGYFRRGTWTPAGKKPSLHHQIWEEVHGRKVPPGYVVQFADGNKNNHAPANLVLADRDSICRANQATALFRKAREQTALLLKRSQRTGEKRDGHVETIKRLKAA
jgi:hypothetical protein